VGGSDPTQTAKLRIFGIEPLAYLVGKMTGRDDRPVYYQVDGMIDVHVSGTLAVLRATGTSTLGGPRSSEGGDT